MQPAMSCVRDGVGCRVPLHTSFSKMRCTADCVLAISASCVCAIVISPESREASSCCVHSHDTVRRPPQYADTPVEIVLQASCVLWSYRPRFAGSMRASRKPAIPTRASTSPQIQAPGAGTGLVARFGGQRGTVAVISELLRTTLRPIAGRALAPPPAPGKC